MSSSRSQSALRRRLSASPAEGKELWYDFCEGSTLHGIPDLHRANSKWDRGFWVCAIFAGMLAAALGCYGIISHYLDSPIVASYTIRTEESRMLPDLIVCPFSRFNSTFMRENNISAGLAQYAQLAFGFSAPYHFLKQPAYNFREHAKQGAQMTRLLERINLTFLEFIETASLNCHEFVQYCVSAEYGLFDCCMQSRKELTTLGVCFRIPGVNQSSAGYGFGLTLVVKTANSSLIAPSYNVLHNDGISVKLAERNRGVDLDLTFMPEGVHALMPLRATKYEFLDGHPRYRCIREVEDGFSSTRCFESCFFAPLEEVCNCTHIIIAKAHPQKLRACMASDITLCAMQELKRRHAEMEGILQQCQAKCKSPCHYWEFQPTVSYSSFPAATIQRYVSQAEYENMKRYIILEVFFEQLDYTLIKHHPSMTIDTFISNVGGQIGLWVGGSVLTSAQILVFLVQLCWFYTRLKLRKFTGSDDDDQLENDL